ncbi:type III glutamate--ammonia ligase [Streptomycetaceae bacterium NBC_01309]
MDNQQRDGDSMTTQAHPAAGAGQDPRQAARGQAPDRPPGTTTDAVSDPASGPAPGRIPVQNTPVDAAEPSLPERVKADGARFVLATFVDLTGKPCAKLVPAHSVDRLASEGAGFAGYAAGALGQTPADPEVMAIPDPASYTPLPFVRPGLAMVHCDPYVEGKPWPFAPRVILRTALERLAAAGFTAQVGAEAEYFLVARDGDALSPADPRDRSAQPCYDARALTRMYDHLTRISDAVNALGWDNYANDHEDANGQFEQNFTHADALTTADRIITFRYLIHALSEAAGMTATFMPKPFTDRTGLHLHMSLWDEGDDPAFPDSSDTRGLGLSDTAYGFIAGILRHAPALQSVIAPTVNSYKRTGATSTASGATWAPRTASYGGNDRTHLIRVPDQDRFEVRAVDGAANPYLAIAVLLGAGLDGLNRNLDAGPPGRALDQAPPLPPTLLHAAEALAADDVVRGTLDAADPLARVSGYYGRLKREEFMAWHSQVTPWEIDRYLTAF